MRVLLLGGLIASGLCAGASNAAAQPVRNDSYLDENARELVRLARARRVTTDRRIEAYHTTAVERISVGLSAGIGEKLLYRRETATRIDWQRNGPVDIEIIGAREVIPPVSGRPNVPLNLSRYVPHLAFDPVDSEMLLRFDTTVIRHPLAAGSETHYRFATGDSTVISLPDGRQIRLRELRILPRRRDPHLISGSFWLDDDTHAVVQAYFKLARTVSSGSRDGGRPRILQPTGELDYIAIDYGLWDLRWWLPRTVAAHGVVEAGPVRMPMKYERRYSDYVISGDTAAPVPVPGEAPVVETRPCRPPVRFTVVVAPADPPDTTSDRYRRNRERRLAARDSARARAARRAATEPDSSRICDRRFNTTRLPAAELLNSPVLPPSIFESDAEIISAEQLRSIGERVRRIAEPAWQLRAPSVQWGLGGPGLVRYNRVEGVSLGARSLLDLGRLDIEIEGRFGTADRDIAGELAFSRRGPDVTTRLAAYHRLDAVDIATRPFSFDNTLGALLLGTDDDDYFRATGAELRMTPSSTRTQWYELRLFAERQHRVEKNTDFSIAHVIDNGRVFRENRTAAAADQLGARMLLRAAHGVDPASPNIAGEVELHGETGDYDLLRPRVRVRTEVPVRRRIAIGVEAEAGTTFGDALAQRLWQVGGARTMRGYDAGTLIGDTFWRGRVELGLGLPAARLALFGDAGWAGMQDEFARSTPIRSLGIGASVLDGLLRLDVARAVDQPLGWKLHLHLNSVL